MPLPSLDAGRPRRAVEAARYCTEPPSPAWELFPLRTLCIADEYPWPARNGYRIRLANVLTALASLGPVDLLAVVSGRDDLDGGAEAPVPGVRVEVVHRGPYRPTVATVPRWLRSGWPRAVAWQDWRGAALGLARWASPPYDAVWYSHCDCWLALGDPGLGPAVVDLDNLEDEKLRSGQRIGGAPRRGLRGAAATLDSRRWAAVQARATLEASAVVVCSDLDRERLGRSAVVVPNGFDEVPVATGDPRPPVLTTVGLLTYEPNLDGAAMLAGEVLPIVRESVPDASVRLVGRHGGDADALGRLPGVEVLGEVDDLDPVFASTSVVAVPVRFGSGTRIKVLEGFARRLPVVSTSLGCEGLAVRPGVDLLVGDTPTELARACVALLRDAALSDRIAAAGHRVWEAHYRWSDVRAGIARLVTTVAGA